MKLLSNNKELKVELKENGVAYAMVEMTESEETAIKNANFKTKDGLVVIEERLDIPDLISEIDKINTKKAAANKVAIEKTVQLLDIAVRDNLSHGKSWACSSNDVDTKFLPPHWEGEQICYIYA